MPVSTWWRHQMETFSALLAICAENSPVPGEFPTQRPVTRSFDVYFDLRPNKRLSKQSWGWWFETQSRPLWRHRNESYVFYWLRETGLPCWRHWFAALGNTKLCLNGGNTPLCIDISIPISHFRDTWPSACSDVTRGSWCIESPVIRLFAQ